MKCQNPHCNAEITENTPFFRKKRLCKRCWGHFRHSPADHEQEIEDTIKGRNKPTKIEIFERGLFKLWSRKRRKKW